MAVYLLHDVIDIQLLCVQLHFFPIFYEDIWSAKINCIGTNGVGVKHVLNLSAKKLGSWLSRLSTVVLIFMVVLALAGRCARKTRHVLEGFVNGLNLVVTSVMCFVIMATCPPTAEAKISFKALTLILSRYLNFGNPERVLGAVENGRRTFYIYAKIGRKLPATLSPPSALC